jgi:uncharacterized protein (DUF4415 family)
MADENHVVFDDDNPEWTEADFAAAKPAEAVLPAAVMEAYRRGRGRPARSTKADAKQQVTLRLDREVIEKFRATGPGWQSRINEILRGAVGT